MTERKDGKKERRKENEWKEGRTKGRKNDGMKDWDEGTKKVQRKKEM